MTTFQSALDRISKAAQTAGIEVGQAASSPFERISSAVASVEPGAAPGMAASEQDIMGIAARGYEDQLLIPKLPTAAKVATLGLEPREIERGLRTQMTQAAQAVATPGLRAQFIESVLDPLLAVTFPMAYGSLPRPVKTLAAKGLSQALEPSGSGLSVEDLRTEQVAARGAAAGMAAGQEQGFAGEVARGVGQSIPQFLGVAGAVATGQVPAAAAIASQALIPLSAWTGGQLSYMDELDAKRAEEALSGAELSQFDLGEMRKRATASAAIQTGVEVVGAGVGAKAIGNVAGRIAATKPGRAVIARLSEAGQPLVARALASKAGQAGTEAFARATNATGRIGSGFLGNAGKIVAISGAEESAEELATAILESPFTEAPLSDDLKNGVYAAFVGAAAGGVGGVGAVGGAVARKAIVNRREAFRPENDAEIRLRQMHTEAQKARTNWTEDLDESQQAQVSVALNSLNGMAPEERGIFLRDLSDTRSDIESRVEKLLARRQELDAALAGARDAQRTYEAGAPERAAKETLVSEAQAAFDKASEDLRAAQELLTEAESEAQKRPRVARPGRVVVSTEQRQANLEAARSEVAAAQARLESAAQEAGVAEGLEIAPGLRIDPAATVAGIERDIASTDEEMRLLVTDRLVADATYNAVREKISDMPMEYRQQEPSAVLSGIGTSSGVQLNEVKAPKRGGRITREMEALGVRVVWFRGKDKKFGAPAFHSMESRGVVYLNADADMSQVRAKAFHELFHDIQMFRPEIAKAYADRVGLAPIYEAGAKYARGRAESASKQRMDALARIQAAAAGAGLAGFEVAVPAATARAGAARLQQEGEAEAFGATAARVTGRGVLNPFVQFAARRGLMGRDVAAAMAVIDMASRAAAVERVSGVKPVATLSPLARTLLWAEDMAVDIPLEIEQATKPEQEAPAAPAPAAPSPGISMAREFPSRPLSSFTPEWREWFSDSKVVDADGNPLPAYHATRAGRDFDVFKITKDLGYHFASTPEAADRALGSRIGGATQSGGARIYPVYLSIKNPLRVSETGSKMMGDLGGWDFGDLIGQFYRPVKLRQSNLFRYEPEANEFDIPEGMSISEAMRTGKVTRTESRPGLIDMTTLEYVQKINSEVRAELGELTKSNRVKFNKAALQKFVADLKRLGYDGMVYKNIVEGGGDSWIAFDSNQIKSVFNERPTAAPGISMARASDDEYFAAIERGDMTAVQAMVDAAARAAGYIYSAFHGSRIKNIVVFRPRDEKNGMYFSSQPVVAGTYTGKQRTGRVYKARLNFRNPLIVDAAGGSWKDLSKSVVLTQDGMPSFTVAQLFGYANAFTDKLAAAVRKSAFDGIIVRNVVDVAGGAKKSETIPSDIYIALQPTQIKSADPIVRDADGNIIPLSKRFDVSRPEISYARSDEDSEVDSLRKQIADLQRQVRDVQNVTAAQRANALREVRVLERRLVTAERIAEQKTLQATRAKMRLELERQAAQEDVAAVERDMAKVTSKLDASQAAVKQMRTELSALRRGERLEERLADAERTAQRAIDWAYAIGRNEGLLAGEVRGQQVERRQVRKLSQRLDDVQARLDKAIPALREARAQIKSDSAAAQRAIDFAYGMGLAKGRIQGVMEGRRQVLKRMARREDVLQNQLFNLRKVMQERAERAEDVRDAAQAIARDAARMLPERLRGPLAVRIANVKTPEQANRIAIVAVKLAVDAEVNESIAAIARLRKQLKKRGMRYATRQRVEALLDSAEAGLRTSSNRRIRAVVTPGKGPKAGPIGPAIENAVDIYAAVVDSASKVEQATLLYQLDRNGYLVERAQRIARYDALRNDLVNAMSGRPTLEERERSDLPPRLSIARRIARANSDIYTLMLELEGTSTGVINELLSKAQAGKGEASLEHASILRQIVPALEAAGYSSISDYALKNGLLGQASAQVRTVQFGGEDVTVPVGTILSIAAMDDETLSLFPSVAGERGQSIKFPDSGTTREFYPTQQDIAAIRSGLSAEERGLVDAMKNILETQVRDRVFESVFLVEGDMPPVVNNYWPRVRETQMKADANVLQQTAGNLVRSALTSVGFAQARIGGTMKPLLYSDAFQTWERHVQVSLDMIHMAQPYRDAATVLSDPAVVRGLDMQMGRGTAEGLLAIFSNGVGATARSNPTLIDKLTNNITGAILAMRPRTLGKVVVGGQIRLMSEIPVEYMARGVARSTKPRMPQSWNARIDEIHAVNGYFNRRHQLHMRSIISGSLSDADRVKVSTAWQASIDSLRATGNNLAAAQLTDAFENFKDAGNGANLMIAAAVDALRYMDEQIMLTAVEARLAEVEDEGVLTGQDALREAALRAERDFRRTQNASDEFDDTFFAATSRVKGQQGWRLLLPFTSDPLKARNQIRRAYLSGDRRLETAAAIGGNAAASTIIGSASLVTVGYMVSLIAGLLGGDEPTDEEEKKFKEEAKKIPARLASEILSSTAGIPGVIMGQVVQGMQYRRPLFAPLLGRPIEQAGREMTADDLPVLVRIIPATLALTQYLGFPMYGLYEFVKDFIPEGEKTPQEKMRERIERRRESMTPEKIRERIQRRISQ